MPFSVLKQYFDQAIATKFLKVLLLIDLVFIIGHLIVVALFQSQPSTLLLDAEDIGFPELFQYLKYSLVIAFSTYIVLSKKKYSYLPFIGLFVVLLLDDVFQIHAKASYFLMYRLSLSNVLFGQITYLVSIGLLSLTFTYPFYRQASKVIKKRYKDIALLMAFFFLFGIGVDLIHSLLEHNNIIIPLLTLVEEGGEMITLSLLVWYFCFLSLATDEHNFFLHQFLFFKKCLNLQ